MIGTRFRGVPGVDRFLRTLHHPDKRATDWITSVEEAHPAGPRFTLETRWFTEWTVYFYGTQDREIHDWIAGHAKRDWTAIDVGANFGYFTCLLASQCSKVHAFEPVPWLADRLRANVALNGFEHVRVNSVALSDQSGHAKLNVPDPGAANWGTSSLLARNTGAHRSIDVELVTFDSYCAAHGVEPNFLKIDVEGAENLVLRGARAVIAECKPTMILELNPESAGEVCDQLQGAGYRLSYLDDGKPVAGDNRANLPRDVLATPA